MNKWQNVLFDACLCRQPHQTSDVTSDVALNIGETTCTEINGVIKTCKFTHSSEMSCMSPGITTERWTSTMCELWSCFYGRPICSWIKNCGNNTRCWKHKTWCKNITRYAAEEHQVSNWRKFELCEKSENNIFDKIRHQRQWCHFHFTRRRTISAFSVILSITITCVKLFIGCCFVFR